MKKLTPHHFINIRWITLIISAILCAFAFLVDYSTSSNFEAKKTLILGSLSLAFISMFCATLCSWIIDSRNTHIPIYRQCELLGLARSTYYYDSQRQDSYNQMLMGLIDEQFTRIPFYGVPRMTAWLKLQGQEVNHKRVRRLMRL